MPVYKDAGHGHLSLKPAIEKATISRPDGFFADWRSLQRGCGDANYVQAVECGAMEPGFVAGEAGRADAGLFRRQSARRCRGAAGDVSAIGLRRRSAQSQES